MKKFICYLMAAIVAVSCTKTYVGPRTTIIVNGYIPYYGWNLPVNDKGECGIFFGNYIPATKASSVNGHFVGPNECGYDSFNMFAFKDGEAVMNPYLVNWDGESWTYEIGSQELQYFDRNSQKYDFIGVIADNATNDNGIIKVNAEAFEDNSGEMNTEKEVLYSITTVEKAAYNAPVSINFKHANAKMYIGFASDRNDTEIVDYTPSSPQTSIPGNITTEHAKMFDLLAEGKLVGYGLIPNQGDYNGYYAGMEGNFFNLNPYHGGYNYVSKERLAELMPIVNAQFVYTDAECNYVDKWEYGVDKKDKMFLKFADGVDGAEFIAGNDAFWSNLTTAEKAGLQKYKDSGCRVIRIEQLPDGNYFAWGESYALASWVSPTSTARDFKVINGGTPGYPAVIGYPGIRVFSVSSDTNGKNIRTAHTTEARADITGVCALTKTADSGDGPDSNITFVKPSGTVAQAASASAIDENTNITWSPTVWYALPVDNPDNGYVVKFSYTYNGVTYYDARVHIPAIDSNFDQGYYYQYIIFISDDTNGTTDVDEANNDKDEVDTDKKPISFSVIFSAYQKGKRIVYSL